MQLLILIIISQKSKINYPGLQKFYAKFGIKHDTKYFKMMYYALTILIMVILFGDSQYPLPQETEYF